MFAAIDIQDSTAQVQLQTLFKGPTTRTVLLWRLTWRVADIDADKAENMQLKVSEGSHAKWVSQLLSNACLVFWALTTQSNPMQNTAMPSNATPHISVEHS